MPWTELLAVAAGGAVGAACRYAVGLLSRAHLPATFPYGTLLVNITGSLILGILVGLTAAAAKPPPVIFALVGTGFCGAFTTFSTFATQTLVNNSLGGAVINILSNNILSLGAAALGVYLGYLLAS